MLKKISILYTFFKTRNFTSRSVLLRHQQRALKRLFKKINHDFYPAHSDLDDFPIINKSIFMQNFQQTNRLGINREEALAFAVDAERSRDFSPKFNRITVGLSSGTSGNHAIFLASDKEIAQWAGYILRRMLPRPWLQTHCVAFFLRANSNLYQSVHSKVIRFAFYDLQQPLETHIAALNQTPPSILIAPAQVLRLLAEASDLHIQPQKIISVAEVLENDDKRLIETRFQQTVHQIYQCTEGFLAHTCASGHLHLNEDIVYIEKEFIDRATGRFSPIITDFKRLTQPIIRYRLDDILIENKVPCPCGSVFTRIEKIEGRCDDILHMHSKDNHAYLLFPDFIRNSLAAQACDVSEYSLIKCGQQLHIYLQPLNAHTRAQVEDTLHSLYQTHNLQPLAHYFHPYFRKPLDQKRRRVREEI